MNDTELDQLLETWEAPTSPPSLRRNLRARFPRTERRSFARPLRWVLAIAVASATLAIGMEQSGANPWDFQIVRCLNRLYEGFMEGLAARQASNMVNRILQSEPKVYVDGQLVAPSRFVAPAKRSSAVSVVAPWRMRRIRVVMDGHVTLSRSPTLY